MSSGAILIFEDKRTSPVSMPSSINMVVTPVSVSLFMIAHWIGAAPRYFGSSDACMFIAPIFGSARIFFGSI